MLDHVYSIEPVRSFLRERGAQRLGDDDAALPTHLQGKAGEHWLLPTGWRHAQNIVVRFGPTYPDDPPTLFLPAEPTRMRGERDLLPHVSTDDDICTVVRTDVINPHFPLQVLQHCLAIAESNLDREWTDAQMAAQINPELIAYWARTPMANLVYHRADLVVDTTLEVQPWSINTKFGAARPATAAKFVAPARLAVVATLTGEETVPFLRTPGAYLATSPAFRASLATFAEGVYARTAKLKTIDLFVLLVVPLAAGECIMAGVVPQAIQAKSKSAPQLVDAIIGVLSTKGLRPVRCANIDTDRLLRRTTGPHFDPSILERRVAIIGCGSLGSFLADGLARSGVRRQFLCDSESLQIENILRHLLPTRYLQSPKVVGLRDFLLERVPDATIEICQEDIRTQSASAALAAFAPDLVVFATGDTNTNLTMSRLLPLLRPTALTFTWADSDLAAGHLVYQPAGVAPTLRDLYVESTGHYRHSMADPAASLPREVGCQGSYSPYSGLEMAQFANNVSMRLLDWLRAPPPTAEVLRLARGASWENLALPSPLAIVEVAA